MGVVLQYTNGDTSSVSLRLPPSAPVSATPTAFAPQIGQFPTGEGWRNVKFFSSEIYLDEFDSLSSNGEVQECVENLASKLGKLSPVGEGGAGYRDG